MIITDSVAIIAGKVCARAIRAAGLGLGSNLPGRLARKISPGLLGRLSAQRRKGVLAVSGTNGKSTTSGLIVSILRRAGLKTIHNRQGANLVTGITATVVEASSWNGRLNADYCLFEIDEASLPVVASEVALSAVLVTNLFRDQLDRFGELDTTARLLNKGISVNHCQAILNADDPNVAQLGTDSPRIYYGVESLSAAQSTLGSQGAKELSYCSNCGKEFEYTQTFYGQLGHYHCVSCGNSRPAPQVVAQNVTLLQTGSSFTLKTPHESIAVHLSLPGMFNVYNALAASALAMTLNIPAITIKEGLTHYTTLFGRSEKLTIQGKSVIIQLIKNPAGASQVVSAVTRDDTARILISINDNLADGRDISWLWDADFELLNNHDKALVVSGQRAEDMAVRMKYAGLPSEQIQVIPALEQALTHSLESLKSGETLWILPTYTCLLELQKIFKSMGHSLAGT